MKISVMGRSPMILGLVLAAATLVGCGRSEPEAEDQQVNQLLEEPIEAENAPMMVPPPIDAPANVAEAPLAPVQADPSDEVQMHEDADAVGLTARTSPSEEAPVATGNEAGVEK